MNAAYIHVVLNHIPVIGTLIGLVFFVIGLFTHNKSVVNSALVLFVFMAIFSIPTFLTGEPAEKILVHTAGFSSSVAHEHEESAELAFIISLITGAISIISLFMKKFSRINKNLFMVLVLIFALTTSIMMIRTAHLGGKIRRPELRNESVQPQNADLSLRSGAH